MNILILGAAGFIGTNLTLKLAEDQGNTITLVDRNAMYFDQIKKMKLSNLKYIENDLQVNSNFKKIVCGQDVIYHLLSTTVPTTSNQHISQELMSNVILTSNLLDACVKCGVKKIAFISSGGTVYGKDVTCPLKEEDQTKPINSYGIQKITIEKLLYLYKYMYGLDYRIIRLANPYGPYQRPNGVLGVVTTFTYKALKNEKIIVYGDGSVVRDFIYIEDAIKGILNIVNGNSIYRTFNLGCGYGTSIKEVLECIGKVLNVEMKIEYTTARKVDVPVNFLDISRYEKSYGKLNAIPLKEGIVKTAKFMKKNNIV